ncbi:MAG TPA: hypothetical protein VHG71_08505 [Verrucomicrobiae bacterium]|nr:hypothetical protein [Verrucomicrobiae bacterium]
MKTKILFGAITLLAGSLFAADSTPKDDVLAAAKKLGSETNYSWHATVVVPDDAQFKPGPTDGKTEKGEITYVKLSFGDNSTEIFMKGTNAAITNPDGDWQSLAELEGDSQGPGRFMAGFVRNFKAPAAQVADLVAGAKELKKDGDAISGDLTEAGARDLLAFRRGGGASVSNPSGSVKFWIKDGELAKYEFKVKGKVSFNGNDFDVDRDTTVEIKDVGKTKIDMPDAAKKKLL